MFWAPPGRLAPLLHWTSTGPPTHNRIKARLDVRGQGRMILSSTPDHTINTLTNIMVFPADRPGMPLFVLVFFFILGLSGMLNYTICKGNIGFRHHPKCLFVCIANCGGKLGASQRWTKNCFVVEVKWSFQDYITLYRLCFLYFTHSSFVLYA